MSYLSEESAPLFPTVHRRVLEFERICASNEDEPLSESPKISKTSQIIEHVNEIVSEETIKAYREIADTVSISDEQVLYILHKELNMKNLFGNLEPNSLIISHLTQGEFLIIF